MVLVLMPGRGVFKSFIRTSNNYPIMLHPETPSHASPHPLWEPKQGQHPTAQKRFSCLLMRCSEIRKTNHLVKLEALIILWKQRLKLCPNELI